VHVIRLILAGVCDRYPNLQIVIGVSARSCPSCFSASTYAPERKESTAGISAAWLSGPRKGRRQVLPGYARVFADFETTCAVRSKKSKAAGTYATAASASNLDYGVMS
jgi:hypothetical protein